MTKEELSLLEQMVLHVRYVTNTESSNFITDAELKHHAEVALNEIVLKIYHKLGEITHEQFMEWRNKNENSR